MKILNMYYVLGKITIYQLSALLKQADSSKRKLTLTRLNSIPIPFTVLSLSGNPWNEDLLAVCGLRECHIITFTVTGECFPLKSIYTNRHNYKC